MKPYQLKEPSVYHYVNQSETGVIAEDRNEFETMLKCMQSVKFSLAETTQVLDTVVGVLNLGNIQFHEHNDGVSPTVQSKEFFIKAAELLKADVKQLIRSMTKKVVVIGGERLESSLTLEQAYQARDTLAKHLYGSLFNWIVSRVNQAIAP